MILAIDTATRVTSIALHSEDEVIAEITWRTTDNHTVELAPAVQQMMAVAQVAPRDLRAVAVAGGPGSYTGLRIGMSLAKGIVLAVSPPPALIAVPTLDIVAYSQPHLAGTLWVTARAGRGRINAARYVWDTCWRSADELLLTTWQALTERFAGPVQVAGEVDAVSRDFLSARGDATIVATPAVALRRAACLAEIAAERLRAGEAADSSALAPVY
ncbi:MAG: tRNA (adenosine(37)-N6)-threonylcarbamoyltransferase complex dimerization subunit type 1 TsaB [Anaerolineae bacterium]|nr:tRNA (adenosine(37)-N6)-threonylcarbamoyltransferase complex dimerization subunit type 1 TsaB [Anaerolineae bacterium]